MADDALLATFLRQSVTIADTLAAATVRQRPLAGLALGTVLDCRDGARGVLADEARSQLNLARSGNQLARVPTQKRRRLEEIEREAKAKDAAASALGADRDDPALASRRL